MIFWTLLIFRSKNKIEQKWQFTQRSLESIYANRQHSNTSRLKKPSVAVTRRASIFRKTKGRFEMNLSWILQLDFEIVLDYLPSPTKKLRLTLKTYWSKIYQVPRPTKWLLDHRRSMISLNHWCQFGNRRKATSSSGASLVKIWTRKSLYDDPVRLCELLLKYSM